MARPERVDDAATSADYRDRYEALTGCSLRAAEFTEGPLIGRGAAVTRRPLPQPVSLNLQTFVGGFFGGSRVTLNPTLRFRVGEALTTQVTYSRNDVKLPYGIFVTNLLRVRSSFSFNPNTFVQALVQDNDRADVWSMNLRFGWLQAANTGLFIVYNDTRGLYDLFDRPERTDRSLIIKFSRMFDVMR
ncbi:MAG: hypothetical protein H0X67_12660 [Acidobacteria bacterium]|nr:hypothetical protein [Acidobacteriota bacterium]